MKSLTIPFFSELSHQKAEDIIDLLEQNSATHFIDSINWPDQFPDKPETTFTVGADRQQIYLCFRSKNRSLKANYTEDFSPVWTDTCVEFFVQIPGNDHYYNFEFNCIGACYAAKRLSRENFELLTSDEMKQIERFPDFERIAFDEKSGFFEWKLLVTIPWSLIGIGTTSFPGEIRGNFYACANGVKQPYFVSWNEIDTPKPDFHRPEFFGTLQLDATFR